MAHSYEVDPDNLDARALFNVMTGSIVPRPIGWISTVDQCGVRNLAPYSMFTAVCARPPTVVFCPSYQPPNYREKDTYRNIAVSGEFVINFVDEDTVAAMDVTAAEVAADVDEFDAGRRHTLAIQAGETTASGGVPNRFRMQAA